MAVKAPTLTVIIASVNGSPMIDECLNSLAKQRGEVAAEVIVVDTTGEQTAQHIRQRFPWVKLLSCRERRTIPELRAAGLEHSQGEIVAITEDHCNADKHWYEQIVKAHRAHPECVAVGGAVENGSCERLIDWAVFFCEYSAYMRPLPRGVAADIPGNNVSYKRRAFEGIADLAATLNRGFWESTLHQQLSARGERFLLEPSIVVYHSKRFGIRYFLSQRYHYSRYYAGTLLSGASVPRRLWRAALSPALPPLLLARIACRVIGKRRHLRELVLTTPLLTLFTAAWAIGEWVGALLGPSRSLSVVE